MIKPSQTLVQPTGDSKELNSYLYICGWFLYIWGWLSVSLSPLWSISLIHFSVPCSYKCGQFLYIWGQFIQMWSIFIHLREVLYICGILYIWRSNNALVMSQACPQVSTYSLCCRCQGNQKGQTHSSTCPFHWWLIEIPLKVSTQSGPLQHH